MGNSFNISVKPEIAAAVVKIDAIDAVVDLIRGTDVVNIQANIDDNETLITTIDSVVDNIRNIDVPNIQANIDDNETKIDTIDTVVDAIKLKTDATPQNVRGTNQGAILQHVNSEFQTVVDVSGHGILYGISVRLDESADTIEIKITLDGTPLNIATHTGDQGYNSIGLFPTCSVADNINFVVLPQADIFNKLVHLEFESSLLVESRRSAGAGGAVRCGVNYSLDTF